ncbi:MAG: ACT domain-containing protein [Methanomassiliicoccales archaeon]
MWEAVIKVLGRNPGQVRVARLMLKLGLRVTDENLYCGDIRLGDVAVGRAAGVDRRVVRAAASNISAHAELLGFFERLSPVANLSGVASAMGWSTLEITSDDATQPGILADVSRIISEAGISIRQAIVEDPELTEVPKLFVVTQGELPPALIPALRNARGVREITLR